MTEREAQKGPATADGKVPVEQVGRTGGFRRLVGYQTSVWKPDYAEIALDIEAQHLNSLGYVHGGVYTTLLDAAFGHAVCFCNTPGNVREAVTISLTTTYLAPGQLGLLTARARLVGVEGRIATCEGDVVAADGIVCARGQATFYYMKGSEKPEGVARKPKWAKG